MKTILGATLLSVLALAAPASAATVGSDLTSAPDQTLGCPGGSPCTMAWDAAGFFDGELADDSTLTSWSASLSPGTKARLRLLRRGSDGTFTGAGASATVTASGGIQTFETRIGVPAGNYTIGVDILEGGLHAAPDAWGEFGVRRIAPVLGTGESREGTTVSVEPLFGATTEPGNDGSTGDPVDGGGGGGGSDTPRSETPAPIPAPAPEAAPAPVLPDAGTAPAKTSGPAFAVDARALLRGGKQGDQGHFDVYYANNERGVVDATITVRSGKRTVGTKQVSELDWSENGYATLRLDAKERKALKRKGKLKLSVTAKGTRQGGGTVNVSQALTVSLGGDSRYDGEYRGPGPFTISVQRGAIRAISGSVNAFCPSSNRFQMLSVFRLDGFPVLVGKDGSFSAEGNVISQLVRYEGKLKRKGASKGVASVYKTTMRLDSSNRFQLDGCQGVTNWTVKRVK